MFDYMYCRIHKLGYVYMHPCTHALYPTFHRADYFGRYLIQVSQAPGDRTMTTVQGSRDIVVNPPS